MRALFLELFFYSQYTTLIILHLMPLIKCCAASVNVGVAPVNVGVASINVPMASINVGVASVNIWWPP